MPQSKEQPKYRAISLNSTNCARALSGLALTFPLWGLILPAMVLSSSYDYAARTYSSPNEIVTGELIHAIEFPLLALSLACLYFTIRLNFNRVDLLVRESVSRPDKLNSNLSSVRAFSQKGRDWLEFKLKSGAGAMVRRAPASHIRAQDAALLINIINDAHTPIADKEVLKVLRRQKLGLSERTGQDSLVIDYASHMSMRRLTAVLAENQRYFWLSWATLCALASILTFATVSGIIPHWIATHFYGVARDVAPSTLENQSLQMFATIMAVPAGFISMLLVAACAPATIAMSFVSNNPYGQFFLLFGSILSVLFLLNYLIRPNRLLFDKNGIKALLNFGSTSFTFNAIKWDELAAVHLVKPAVKTDPSRWLLRFLPVKGQPFDFSLGGLRDTPSKLAVLSAIEKWAPHVDRDPEVEESLRSGATQSYTELWLESLATPPKREKLTPLVDGQSLKDGKYLIHRQYGAGGQGLTYLASDMDEAQESSEEASLIIKESMLPLYVDEEARKKAVERFEKEALLLSNLKSDHIAQLKDYFIEDHRSYLVLSRIKGMDLKHFVEVDGPLPAKKVLELAGFMCDILEYLHSLTPPVVHRDFTPDNLILSSSGMLKLIDFEVAHEMKSRTTATVVGKHAYIPPEQLRGKPEAASDFYAMGATLYFLATGSDPEPLERSRLPQAESPEELKEELKEADTYKKLSDLIYSLTALEADKRSTLSQVREMLALKSESISNSKGEHHVIYTGEKQEEALFVES